MEKTTRIDLTKSTDNQSSMRTTFDVAEDLVKYGDDNANVRDYAAAMQYYREAAQTEPRYAKAWYKMAMLYEISGSIEHATQCMEKAAQLAHTAAQQWLKQHARATTTTIPPTHVPPPTISPPTILPTHVPQTTIPPTHVPPATNTTATEKTWSWGIIFILLILIVLLFIVGGMCLFSVIVDDMHGWGIFLWVMAIYDTWLTIGQIKKKCRT